MHNSITQVKENLNRIIELYYINLFKEHLIKYAFSKLEQKVLKQSGDHNSDYFTFKAPELYNQITTQPQGYIPHTPMSYQPIHGINPMPYNHANTVPFYPPTYFYMGKLSWPSSSCTVRKSTFSLFSCINKVANVCRK